jgi:hypothetical protein
MMRGLELAFFAKGDIYTRIEEISRFGTGKIWAVLTRIDEKFVGF